MTTAQYLASSAPSCDQCCEPKADVRPRIDPFTLNVCNYVVILKLCNRCRHERWLEV